MYYFKSCLRYTMWQRLLVLSHCVVNSKWMAKPIITYLSLEYDGAFITNSSINKLWNIDYTSSRYHIMTVRYENPLHIPDLLPVKSLVTGGFPSHGASNMAIFCCWSQWWVINIDSANGLLPTDMSRNMLSFDFCSCSCMPEQAVEPIITLACIWYAMALLWCHRNVPSMPYQRQHASVYIKLYTLWPICDKEPCQFFPKSYNIHRYFDTSIHS